MEERFPLINRVILPIYVKEIWMYDMRAYGGCSMNIAVIFAGGMGTRMNSNAVPKQFLKLQAKEIIIYTVEKFERSPLIDGIVIVSLESWIQHLWRILGKYEISKVMAVVAGGKTGQESIYNGIKEAEKIAGADGIVLIHDGVRPLIDQETIERNIHCVQTYGNAITTAPVTETVLLTDENGGISDIPDRIKCRFARAPQSFYVKDILAAHEQAQSEGRWDFVDSATMMAQFGYSLHMVDGPFENIKITTPYDFYLFKAYQEAMEARDIFGI